MLHDPAADVNDVESAASHVDPPAPTPPTGRPASAEASPAPPVPDSAAHGYAPVARPYAATAPAYGGPAARPADPAFGYAVTPPYDPAVVAAHTPAAPKGIAIAALVVGIVAFLIGWLPVGGAIAGVVAVGLGIVALVRRQSNGLAITGLVLGAIAFFTSIVISIVMLGVATNISTLEQLVDSAAPSEIVDESEPPPAEADGAESAVPADEFATLDAAAFAALVAAPTAQFGEAIVLFGEVQQLAPDGGSCEFFITVDAEQQSTWEGYAAWALAFASSSEEPETTCAETAGVGELSHVQLYATVLGVTTVESDDGTVEDMLTLDVHRVEFLPELP